MSEVILFGVTGDLSRKRLIPALARAWSEGGIPKSSRFVGFGRKDFTEKEFQAFINEHSPVKDFSSRWKYIQSELDDINGYKKLLGKKGVIYISLPPKYQTLVVEKLFQAKVLKKNNGLSLAIEKPFGSDSKSAIRFNKFLKTKLSDKQIYRVDHYAGKEEVLNIEKQKGFSHGVKDLESLEITFFEKGTAIGRGAFYDHVGALNDVCQNHMLHMLATVVASPYAHHPRYGKIRASVVEALKLQSKPILGQYNGFRKEEGVDRKSNTETFFRTENVIKFKEKGLSKEVKQLKMNWQGMKVILTGGKAMKEDVVSICFHGKSKESTSTCIVTSRHGMKDAYQTIFEAIAKGDRAHSIDIEQVVAGWKYVESVKSVKVKLDSYR